MSKKYLWRQRALDMEAGTTNPVTMKTLLTGKPVYGPAEHKGEEDYYEKTVTVHAQSAGAKEALESLIIEGGTEMCLRDQFPNGVPNAKGELNA